jgi:serine/threonine protein phosphatase PrpC
MSLFRRLFGSTESKPPELPANEQPKAPEILPESTAETQPETPPAQPPKEASAQRKPDATPIVRPPLDLADGATRQLPAEKVISVSNTRLSFGQATDVGLIRPINQDAVLSFFSTSSSVDDLMDFGIFIVADGMGGHVDGEKASAITAHIIADEITSTVYLPILSGENLAEMPPITEVLISAVQRANTEVYTQITKGGKGGGTTCTTAVVLGDRAYMAHVGDSRAYLITKEGLEQLTRDHSMVQRLKELGQLTEEEAANHPRTNELYRALGFKEELEVDALSRRLPPNSKLLLCSDGLWNTVPESDILNIITNYPDPQEACNKLVAMANTNGGHDNITVILLRTG